jgi:predicted nucleic acid-binding protein
MIVVDASVIVALLIHTPVASALRERFLSETLHAPHLIDLEVMQTLRRLVRSREMMLERAYEALDDFNDMRIERYPHSMFLMRVWELRSNLTAYDAVYVALAEELNAVLLTLDARLAAAPGMARVVEIVT